MPKSSSYRKKQSTLKSALQFLSVHEWTIIGILAGFIYVAGCIGYYQLFFHIQPDGNYSILDAGYFSIQLFILEAAEPSADWPWYLQLARLLAPLTLTYAALKAIFNQLGVQISLSLLRLRHQKYIVICGLGETGFRIAKDFINNSNFSVIAIESSTQNPLASEIAAMGGTVVFDNAMNPNALKKVHVGGAKYVFVFSGDDEINIAIAKAVERICRKSKPKEKSFLEKEAKEIEGLRCFVAVEHPDLYEVFSSNPFFSLSTQEISISVFNQSKVVARNIMRLCAPDLYHKPNEVISAPVHILLLGFEAITRELIIEHAVSGHYADKRKPTATLLCPAKSADLIPKFLRRFPQLPNAIDLHIVIEEPLTLSENKWNEIQRNSRFTCVYVAMTKDVEAIISARRLNKINQSAGHPTLNIVVCLNQQTYLSDILDDDFKPITMAKSGLPAHEAIEYFETLDETINRSIIVDQKLDDGAKALHEAYREEMLSQGQDIASNTSLLPWSRLPPHKKIANQHAAAHLDVKLRIAGYQRAEGITNVAPFPRDQRMLETLAEIEHRRWMSDKFVAGYRYGPVRDDERLLHPDLVDWTQLSETDKDKDRDNIRRIPLLLALEHQHPKPIEAVQWQGASATEA